MISCGIYKITNKVNGKFYIGSSDNIYRRFSSHLLDLKKNRHDNQHLQRSWNKYGESGFSFEIIRMCLRENLLSEEQKELDAWVGKDECYNMRKDAVCPVAPGEHRSEETKKKISAAQMGKPRWTEEQRKQMSIDRMGRKHKPETIAKFLTRKQTDETKNKISATLTGRLFDVDRCNKISFGKRINPKIYTLNDKEKISTGVMKSVVEGRYHKNKIPKEEYDNIKNLYLSGSTNIRQLAFKYGINPSSMTKLLKRTGAK